MCFANFFFACTVAPVVVRLVTNNNLSKKNINALFDTPPDPTFYGTAWTMVYASSPKTDLLKAYKCHNLLHGGLVME